MKLNFTISPDQLPALVAFVRVARHESFTRASAELGISPSALSQTVRGLEARLGVRLLHRSTRRVALSDAGRQFLERVMPALEMLGAAFEELETVRAHPSGLLRITLSRIAAQLLVAPVLGEYQRRCPDVRLELCIDDAMTDLIAGGFDAGIRLEERLAPGMVAVRISPPQRIAVVGSPGYFARHPKPAVPDDLRDQTCIQYRFTGSGALYHWEFERDGRPLQTEVNGSLIVNDNELMIEAARQGLGLAHVFERLVERDIAEGRLVRVLEDWCAPFPGFFLYYPSRAQMPLKLRHFIDVLTVGTA